MKEERMLAEIRTLFDRLPHPEHPTSKEHDVLLNKAYDLMNELIVAENPTYKAAKYRTSSGCLGPCYLAAYDKVSEYLLGKRKEMDRLSPLSVNTNLKRLANLKKGSK